MTGFEMRTSGIWSNSSANWATTTDWGYLNLVATSYGSIICAEYHLFSLHLNIRTKKWLILCTGFFKVNSNFLSAPISAPKVLPQFNDSHNMWQNKRSDNTGQRLWNFGGRHSSVEPSALTILWPRVQIPSTISRLCLFQFKFEL